MRKVPVLTMVGLLLVLCMPVQAATVNASVPDIQMGVGATTSFDVSDMVIGDPAVTGGAITDGVLEVFGSDAAGMLELVVGDDTSVVSVGPTVGYPGLLLIPLMSGDSAEGSIALPDLGGGGGTPGGGTPSGALVVTVGSLGLDVGGNGLRSRVAGEGSGVDAALNPDGSYSITEAGLAGDAVVTLGVDLGASASGVHINVASANPVAIDAASMMAMPAGTLAQVDPVYGGSAALTVAPGQGTLLVGLSAIAVGDPGDEVTLQVDYSADAVDGITVAIIGFDAADLGGLGTAGLAYSNAGAPQIQAGDGTLSVSFTSGTGMVIPGLQVACGAAAGGGTVTLSNLMVISAGALTNYALNPNAKADLPIDGSMASLDGWMPDLIASGAAAPVASDENNFESAAGSGAMLLAGAADHANAATQVSVGAGAIALECYAMAVGGEGQLALVLTGGGGADVEIFAPAAVLSSDGFGKLTVGTELAADAAAFFVVQAAGADVVVDDISVRIVDDISAFFDNSLLGL